MARIVHAARSTNDNVAFDIRTSRVLLPLSTVLSRYVWLRNYEYVLAPEEAAV